MVLPHSPIKLLAIALITLLVSACGDETLDPEAQLKETVEAMQVAAESRKLSDLMSHISESYLDVDGRDSSQLRAIAQVQFLRNPKIHSFKVIKSLEVAGDEADMSLLVAVAGSPIDGIASIEKVRADLMWFDLRFRLDGEWKLVAAEWRPAGSTDFL